MKMLYKNLVLVLLVTSSKASWFSEIFPPDGWHFGKEMVFHLRDTKSENNSFMDRIEMRLDYGDIGVSAVQKPDKKAVQLDLYVREEGRSKKMGNMLLPFMIGAVKGSALTMVMGTVKLMILKSLMITKLALVVSAALLLCKFLKKNVAEPSYLEIDDHFPVIEQEGYGVADSYSADGFGYLPQGGEHPIAGAGSAFSYAATAPSGGISAVPPMGALIAAKRRYGLKRKVVPTTLTVKKYVKTDRRIV